jgi:hypothetical protein
MWFSLGTPVSSTNKSDRHYITEIVLKVTLDTIALPLTLYTILVSDVVKNQVINHLTQG